MVGETVDESVPVGRPRVFFAKKSVFDAYNSKYLRGGIPRSQEVFVDGWIMNLIDKGVRLFYLFGLKAKQRFGKAKSLGGITASETTIKNDNEGSKQVIVGNEIKTSLF